MHRELTYNKWMKYIHDYQLNKNKQMEKEIKVTLKQIADSIQANDFEPSIKDVSERIDYLNIFLEDRRKYLEDKYMGSEEEYAIGDVINLLDLVKNKLNNK